MVNVLRTEHDVASSYGCQKSPFFPCLSLSYLEMLSNLLSSPPFPRLLLKISSISLPLNRVRCVPYGWLRRSCRARARLETYSTFGGYVRAGVDLTQGSLPLPAISRLMEGKILPSFFLSSGNCWRRRMAVERQGCDGDWRAKRTPVTVAPANSGMGLGSSGEGFRTSGRSTEKEKRSFRPRKETTRKKRGENRRRRQTACGDSEGWPKLAWKSGGRPGGKQRSGPCVPGS